MFAVLITLFILGFLLAYLFGGEQSYTINKTVGSAYAISNHVKLAAFFSLSQGLFIIGYLVVFLLKRKTNYYISIAHFEIIIVTIYYMSFEKIIVPIIFCTLSIILFFVNILKSEK